MRNRHIIGHRKYHSIMRQVSESDEIRMIVPFAAWLDRHPAIANIIIGIMALALAYAVFSYEFTIPAYQ